MAKGNFWCPGAGRSVPSIHINSSRMKAVRDIWRRNSFKCYSIHCFKCYPRLVNRETVL